MKHSSLPALLLLAAVASSTCGAGQHAALHDLRSVDELRTAFNADQGHPRVVLLISPT